MASTSNFTEIAATHVTPVTVSPPVPRRARTELGRKLREIRHRIVTSGQPLLNWDGLDREIRDRRGEERMEE